MASGTGDLVVLLPGIGGSVLQRDGKDVWALTPGAALRSVLSLGGNIKRLALQGDDPEADDLGDGVVATRVLPDLHVIPGLNWKIDGYSVIRTQLIERFGCRPGENLVEFAYDWRRDNRVAARRLARGAEVWLQRWRERSGNQKAKLILIGHSMGGIVSRLYLELFDGWRDTRRLITFGTPYSGSINALDFVVNGFERGWGPFTVDLGDMIRSFTSAYQLLPSYRCLAGPNGTWVPLDDPGVDWSGTTLDPVRLRDALTLHRDLRQRVDQRLAAGGLGYDVRPVVGQYQPTGWAARRVGARVEALPHRDIATHEEFGDGTVPWVSAFPHELLAAKTNVMFCSQRHGSLQNDKAVLDHVGGLLPADVLEPGDVFAAEDEVIRLEVADTVTDEPLVIRAALPVGEAELVADVVPVAGGAPSRTVTLAPSGHGWASVELDDLPATDYRVTVSSPNRRSTTEIASVVDLADLERAADT